MAATVGFFQITSPKRSRRGKQRSWELRNCKTLLADLSRRNVLNTRLQAILDLAVGVFVHLPDGIAYQADRECQG